MLNRFASFLESIAEEGEKLFGRVKDKALFRKVVSASFLIARADGDFDSDEKSALAKIVVKKLTVFGLRDILAVLNDCEEKVAFDETMGVMEIMDDICSATGDDAEMIIRIACYIGAADGDFDADEKKVAAAMGKRMGIDLAKYGL